MDPREERVRLAILGGAVGLLLLAFVYQLVFIQITQGEAYKRKVTQGYTRTQTVVAARGQIVDRYGRPFTTNRISLDIILDRAYLPVGQENQVILELTGRAQESPWFSFLSELRRELPMIQKFSCQTADGQVTALSTLPDTLQEQISKMRKWTYYKLTDKSLS